MSPESKEDFLEELGLPRASGDEPKKIIGGLGRVLSAPRQRG